MVNFYDLSYMVTGHRDFTPPYYNEHRQYSGPFTYKLRDIMQ